MPLSVILPPKKVTLNAVNKKILAILNHLIKTILPDTNGESGLKAGEAIHKDDWSSKVKSYFEPIFGDLNTKESVLLQIDEKLDPPANALKQRYVGYLNDIILAMNKDPNDTTQDVITDSVILVREILIRLVVVALCTRMDANRDGDKIIQILEQFVILVNKEDILGKKDLLQKFQNLFVSSGPSAVRTGLATDHNDIISSIKSMVEIVKLLHKPETTFTNALSYLEKVQKAIYRQLIARLKPNAEKFYFDDDWLSQGLEKHEIGLLKNKDKNAMITTQTANLSLWHPLDDLDKRRNKQKIIIDLIADNKSIVGQLYQLAEKNNLLYQIVSHFDLLATSTGWVLFITGGLKPEALAKQLRAHSDLCRSILQLKPEDPIFKQPAGDHLIESKATSTISLDKISWESYTGLNSLRDPVLIQQLIAIVTNNVNTLASLQHHITNMLDAKESFIDIGLIKQLSNKTLIANQTSSRSLELSVSEELASPQAQLAVSPKQVSKPTGNSDAGDFKLSTNNAITFLSSPNTQTKFEKGIRLYQSESYAKAIPLFTQIIDQSNNPTLNANSFSYRGLCHAGLNKSNEAINDLASALSINEKNPDYLYVQAKIFYQFKNYDEACRSISKILVIDPTDKEALDFMFNILQMMKTPVAKPTLTI